MARPAVLGMCVHMWSEIVLGHSREMGVWVDTAECACVCVRSQALVCVCVCIQLPCVGWS